jgi:hypothetical protein
MTRITLAAILVSGAMGVFAHGLHATQKENFAGLEKEAARALSLESEFSSRADLAARLQAASERATDTEQRARLALLWLRVVRSLIPMLPIERPPGSAFREWLAAHQNVVRHSEIGGWVLLSDFLWMVHDKNKGALGAEEIAWFIVDTGMPSDCEGSIPCYTDIMNSVSGEFLRRYPRGVHTSEAVAGIHSSIVRTIDTLSEPHAQEFLNPNSPADCDRLNDGLRPLRQAIADSNATSRLPTLDAIDRLLARCP